MRKANLLHFMAALRAFPDKWASRYSDIVYLGKKGDEIPPKPPTDILIDAITEGIVISWTNPTLNRDGTKCNDLAWIRIYRSTTDNIDIDDPDTYEQKFLVTGETYTYQGRASFGAGRYYRCIVSAVGADEDATSTSDRGYRARELKKQYFVLTSVDKTGNESLPVDEKSGTPEAQDLSMIRRNYTLRLLDKNTSHEVDTSVGGDFRSPEAMEISAVGAYFDEAGSGSVTTIDINKGGSSILSTKITVDAGEKSSETAATSPVISDDTVAADAILTFDIDGIASGTAGKGLTVWMEVVI